jgi:ankyrin repeat protein
MKNFPQKLLAKMADDDLDEIRVLSSKEPQILSQVDFNKRSLLHWAAQYDSLAVAEWLLDREPALIDQEDEYGAAAIRTASGEGNFAFVLLLLSRGAKLKSSGDTKYGSASEIAKSFGHQDIADYLISLGAD